MKIDKLRKKFNSTIFSTSEAQKVFQEFSFRNINIKLSRLCKQKFLYRISKGLYTYDYNAVNLLSLGMKLIEPHPCYLSLETLLINAGMIEIEYNTRVDETYLPPESNILSKAKYASKSRFVKAKKPKSQKQIFLEKTSPRLDFHLTFVTPYRSMKRTIELPLKVKGNFSKPFIRKITYEYCKIAPNLFFGYNEESIDDDEQQQNADEQQNSKHSSQSKKTSAIFGDSPIPKKNQSPSISPSIKIASLEKALLDYVYIRRCKQQDLEALDLTAPKRFASEKIYKILEKQDHSNKFPNWMKELYYD